MNMSVGDILDRYSIVLLKIEHNPDSPYHNLERTALQEEMRQLIKKYPLMDLDILLNHCKEINSQIWDLEADIRQGALDNDLPEVGRRAIMIRRINGLRVSFKNLITELLKDGFKETKQDHLSE
jgi:hypothetical protein